jgi:hypothetical protein
MFYLTKRTRVADCKVGDRVMVLSDYPGGNILAGEKGVIDEIYGDEGTGLGGGISIRWDKTGRCDGFPNEELQFLAFGTETHPALSADTESVILSDDEATALSCLEDATPEDLQVLWDAMQDRTAALLPYSATNAATYLKVALERLCLAVSSIQEKLTDEGTGYPRDVALTVAAAPVPHKEVVQ